MMRLQAVAQATGGVLIGQDCALEGVSTDTRKPMPEALFVALRGERFDGHEFLLQAAAQGAVAALVDHRAEAPPAGLNLVRVDDTRLALGRLGGWWRSQFRIPVIGVTGSNGKTTVKEMCAAILRAHFDRAGAESATLATQGNLNNDIGLPQMLLRLRAHHAAAVFEMGMNHPGEIAYLAALAAPSVAIVNNAQRAHLEGMGDLDGVAREKGAIYGALAADGVAVINADDVHADYWRGVAGGRRVVTFGLDHPADVTAQVTPRAFGSELSVTAFGQRIVFTLHAPGLHNARNALAAIAATLACGVSLDNAAAGLGAFTGAKGRLQVRVALKGAVMLDDSYNANPDSVRAGIDVLSATPGRTILVLGDMGEIGDMAAQCHDEIGGYAKSQGVDHLLGLGENSAVAVANFGAGGEHFSRPEDLIKALEKLLAPDVVVLVKGSRFMKMERIADAIAEERT